MPKVKKVLPRFEDDSLTAASAPHVTSHRKSVLGMGAVIVVLSLADEASIRWAGVSIDEQYVWICVGIAHLYFVTMWWVWYGETLGETQGVLRQSLRAAGHLILRLVGQRAGTIAMYVKPALHSFMTLVVAIIGFLIVANHILYPRSADAKDAHPIPIVESVEAQRGPENTKPLTAP